MISKHLLASALIAGTASFVFAQQAGQPFDPVQAWSQLQQQLNQQFDINRDGRLTGEEQVRAQEYLRRQGINLGMPPGGFPGADQFNQQFDRNRDGKLDPMERAAAQAAFQRLRNGKGGGGGVQTGSVPSPQPDPTAAGDQKPGKVPPLIKRFDKDGDGKLNDEEKAAAQAELKKTKPKDAKESKEKDGKDGKGK